MYIKYSLHQFPSKFARQTGKLIVQLEKNKQGTLALSLKTYLLRY